MRTDELMRIWAPADDRWSPWVKPVLLAHLDRVTDAPDPDELEVDPGFTPPKPGSTCMVVDLPGWESVAFGLALMRYGYRLVPLFNARPAPSLIDRVPVESVVTAPVLRALASATERMALVPPGTCPSPAFLLDSNRRGMTWPTRPATGQFDNRWVVLSTDLPSAQFLASEGISEVQVIHRRPLQWDIKNALAAWADYGLAFTHRDLEVTNQAGELRLPGPVFSAISRSAAHFVSFVGLKRHRDGGFGGFAFDSSAGG